MALRRLKYMLEVEHTDEKGSTWSNIDLQPTPPKDRNWSPWYFFAFQFSIAFSPTTYNLGASLVAIGLNSWTIVIASIVGTLCCMVILFLNSRGAALYHVGFPVYLRISAGFYGSLFFIFIRGVVAVLYMGTQTYYASRLINVALRCVFGHKWTDIPNQLPESASITSSGMLAFFIFWIVQFPFAWLHPSKAGPVFAVKSWLTPPTYIATMIWALVKAKGAHLDGLGTADASGSELAWSFMKAINVVVSGVIPPLVNIPDLARYAKEPRATYPMVAGLFFSKPVVILFGMVTTSASIKLFNEAYWNLWDFYSAILDAHWAASTRTLVFLASFIQAYATLATNVSSNAIPVGCDLSGLLPRYFTIRRGQILCSLLAVAVVPWKLVNSATSFLTFLGSYVCFICPIVACMVVDYWVGRRGNVHVPSLYRCDPESPYYHWHGFNPRAYAAWVVGVALVISGISGVLNPGSIGQTAVNIYNMGFLLSTSSAALTYFVLIKIWPVRVYPVGKEETGMEWERMAAMEGFFEEDEKPEYLMHGTVIYGRDVEGGSGGEVEGMAGKKE